MSRFGRLALFCLGSLLVGVSLTHAERLTKTSEDAFSDRPSIPLGSDWDDLGPSFNKSGGSPWTKDLFEESIPLGLDLEVRQDGQVSEAPELVQRIQDLLESMGYQLISASEWQNRADYVLHIDIRVNALQTKWQRYYQAVASSDFEMEDLKREHRRYHQAGPGAEVLGADRLGAIDQCLKELERSLLRALQRTLKTRRESIR